MPDVETLVREGDDPVIVEESDFESLVKLAVDFADATLLNDGSPGRLGIIGDEAELEAVAAALKARSRTDEPLEWDWAGKRLTSPITLVPADSAKGLEFDTVFVLEPGKLYDRDPVTGPRLLYVALTRARHGLTIIHSQRLPAAFRGGGTPVDDRPPPPAETQTQPHESPPEATPAPPAPAPPSAVAPDSTLSWSQVVASDEQLVLVRVAGGMASVERLPDRAGAPALIADGMIVLAGNTMAWALRDATGAFAVTTTQDPENAAADVVRAAFDR